MTSVTGLPIIRVGDYGLRLLNASDGLLVTDQSSPNRMTTLAAWALGT